MPSSRSDSLPERLRRLLDQVPEGLTVRDAADRLCENSSYVQKALVRMFRNGELARAKVEVVHTEMGGGHRLQYRYRKEPGNA